MSQCPDVVEGRIVEMEQMTQSEVIFLLEAAVLSYDHVYL